MLPPDLDRVPPGLSFLERRLQPRHPLVPDVGGAWLVGVARAVAAAGVVLAVAEASWLVRHGTGSLCLVVLLLAVVTGAVWGVMLSAGLRRVAGLTSRPVCLGVFAVVWLATVGVACETAGAVTHRSRLLGAGAYAVVGVAILLTAMLPDPEDLR